MPFIPEARLLFRVATSPLTFSSRCLSTSQDPSYSGLCTLAYDALYPLYFCACVLDDELLLIALGMGLPYPPRGVCGEKVLDPLERLVLFACDGEELVVLQADAVLDAFVAVELCLALLADLALHAQLLRADVRTKQAGPLTWIGDAIGEMPNADHNGFRGTELALV